MKMGGDGKRRKYGIFEIGEERKGFLYQGKVSCHVVSKKKSCIYYIFNVHK